MYKMVPQQYCLRWKHHHTNVQNMFAQLLEKERFCDVTLYCSPSFGTQVPNKDTVDPQSIRGVSLRAHRVVLASCSELLGTLLGAHEQQGEPVLVIDGVEPRHVRALLDYMYTGEMNVHHSQLASLLKTAEELRIKGLTDIRWNNKDEPPDSQSGTITATATHKPEVRSHPPEASPQRSPSSRAREDEREDTPEPRVDKFNVNGGPPPLIKLTPKEKNSPVKRDRSDTESPSPKRTRMTSINDNTDDDSSQPKSERDQEWQHGNLDITAERVVGWGDRSWSRDASDDEWADAPADIGSFLDTRLQVQGDNSAEESNDAPPGAASSSSGSAVDLKLESVYLYSSTSPGINTKPTVGPKSGPNDPRFTDVVKLHDYLQHGRRPQFWEENYVKRVMEAVRVKELEMKQAAEILGVSYGTLYGRYRDVYGCINRPYRTARDFWAGKGPADVLDRLQRGEMSIDAAALALGVSHANLSAYMVDLNHQDKEFEPIPIEIDPSLKKAQTRGQAVASPASNKLRKIAPAPDKAAKASSSTNMAVEVEKLKKVVVGSVTDEDTIPATVITTCDVTPYTVDSTTTSAGKWPTIRVASLDTLRKPDPLSPSSSPSQLMKSRPDLTIVAAKPSPDTEDDEG